MSATRQADPEAAGQADRQDAGPEIGGIEWEVLKLSGVVILGALMSILDTTIVNIALRDISQELGSPLDTVQWVVTGYLLALATVIPLSGWISERFDAKRVWMGSIALFMIGSALCGLAGSAGELIAFRVLQGFGGGLIMPVGITLLTQAAGPKRVGRVMSIVGVPMLLGPVLGPVLGGLIVDNASWRWIFYVNIPIGVIALALARRVLRPGTTGRPGGSTGWASCSARPVWRWSSSASPRAPAKGGFAATVVVGPDPRRRRPAGAVRLALPARREPDDRPAPVRARRLRRRLGDRLLRRRGAVRRPPGAAALLPDLARGEPSGRRPAPRRPGRRRGPHDARSPASSPTGSAGVRSPSSAW